MHDEPKSALPFNGGLLKWMLQILGWLVVTVGIFWTQLHYVAKSDFENYKADQVRRDELKAEKLTGTLLEVSNKLQHIADFMEGDKRQDKAIEDLQREVRELERKSPH